MNKRINTLLFVLGATVFNVIIAVLSFFILAILYIKLIMPLLPDTNHSWILIVFLVSLVISFVVYRYVSKYFIKKIDVNKYFDPLFVRKYKR